MTVASRSPAHASLALRPLVLSALALIGAGISLVLASYQLGLSATVWDPIFGDGPGRVLSSAISRALPVPDALLGAGAYAVEAVLGLALMLRRGRPAIVAATLAVVAVMSAVVGVLLALAQPLVAHAGCTLCLTATGISLVLAAGALAEARDRWPDRRPAGAVQPSNPLEEPR